MSRCAVIAGGGSGSQVYPGLAVTEELSRLAVEVHWLGTRDGLERTLVTKRGVPVTLLEVDGELGRGMAATVRFLGQVPHAVRETVSLFLRLEPCAVLGVGGPAAAVGLLAAGLLGLPGVLQERNAAPDRVSRFIAPWADLVCCGFAEAVAYFGQAAEWTGNPVNPSFFAVAAVDPQAPARVLVLGGSRGSMFLNQVVPPALAAVAAAGIPVHVTHQAGPRWAEVVRTSYRDHGLEAEVPSFLTEPWQALARADLVVSRSGALTLAELAAAGRGAVLVPLSSALDNHQEPNARSRERKGGAVVLTESEATPAAVGATLAAILSTPERVVAMGSAARAAALPDAASRIARRLVAAGGAA